MPANNKDPIIEVNDDGVNPVEQQPISILQPTPAFAGTAIDLRNKIAALQKQIADIDKDSIAKKAPIQAELAGLVDYQKKLQVILLNLPPRTGQ